MTSIMKINDILRAQHVKRFHIVHTAKHQSIAEHSFNVAMIGREIAIELGYSKGAVEMVMLSALFHDLDEVITGDIPTPTKRRAKDKGVDLNDSGVEVPYYYGDIQNISKIVKAADYMEAAWFLGENKIGRHAESVENDIIDKMMLYLESTFSKKELEKILIICSVIFGAEFAI